MGDQKAASEKVNDLEGTLLLRGHYKVFYVLRDDPTLLWKRAKLVQRHFFADGWLQGCPCLTRRPRKIFGRELAQRHSFADGYPKGCLRHT